MSIELMNAIDEICERFEDQQQDNAPTRLEDYLPSSWNEEQRKQLIYYLLKIELEYELRRGNTPSAKALKERFADMTEVVDSVLRSLPKSETSRLSMAPPDSKTPHILDTKRFSSYETATVHPKILGNYTLLENIGMGSEQVFKAKHNRMNRLVAIKILSDDISGDVVAVRQFETAIKSVAKLTHPNIVVAYDVGEDPSGLHFLAMEYVEGSDLLTLSEGPTDVSIENTVDYALQVARGLEYIHSQGLVHGNIQPSKLLLGREGTVKILTSGFAQTVDSNVNPEKRTNVAFSSLRINAFDYMAPEQAAGTARLDSRVDVYSLGCTIYKLLTKKAIFEADTLVGALQAHQEAPIPRLRDHRSDAPPQLEAIFERMVAKQADNRFQTLTDVIHELESLQTELKMTTGVNRFTSSTDDSLPDQVGNDSRLSPKRVLFVATGVASLCVAGFGIWTLIEPRGVNELDRVNASTIDRVKPEKGIPPNASVEPIKSWPFDPQDGQEYEWSEPENLGPEINDERDQNFVTVSGDELSLLVQNIEPGKARSLVEYRRSHIDAPWDEEGTIIDIPGFDGMAGLSPDGLALYYDSIFTDEEGNTSYDIFVKRRSDRKGTWGVAERLPPGINTVHDEGSPCISKDGLSLVFDSPRPGGRGDADLYLCRRETLDSPWSEAMNVGEPINTSDRQIRGRFIRDGSCLAWLETELMSTDKTSMKIAMADRNGVWTLPMSIDIPNVSGFPWPSLDGRAIYYSENDDTQESKGVDIFVIRRVPKNTNAGLPRDTDD